MKVKVVLFCFFLVESMVKEVSTIPVFSRVTHGRETSSEISYVMENECDYLCSFQVILPPPPDDEGDDIYDDLEDPSLMK